MKDTEITVTRVEGNWIFGAIGEYRYEVKCWSEPSSFGIEMGGKPGCISKLRVTRAHTYGCVAAYDRGWDRLPRGEEEQEVVQAIIDAYN